MAVNHPQLKALGALHDFFTNDLAMVWGIVFVAWTLVLLAAVTGQDHLLYHEALSEHNRQPLLLKLFVFLGAWQVMIAAMMLPSTLPMVRLFVKASREQPQPRLALLAFLGAYAAVWAGFALIAFVGDIGLHWLFSQWHWLHHCSWLISGLTLVLAGGFQFSSFKEQCLQVCHHPLSFLTHHYQRGLQAAWNLGIGHGLYCLGCCWALMLVLFAVGVGHVTWMIVLTGVMIWERTWKQGRSLDSNRIRRYIGTLTPQQYQPILGGLQRMLRRVEYSSSDSV